MTDELSQRASEAVTDRRLWALEAETERLRKRAVVWHVIESEDDLPPEGIWVLIGLSPEGTRVFISHDGLVFPDYVDELSQREKDAMCQHAEAAASRERLRAYVVSLTTLWEIEKEWGYDLDNNDAIGALKEATDKCDAALNDLTPADFEPWGEGDKHG